MSELLAGDLITPDAGAAPLLSQSRASILKAAPLARLSFRAREAALEAADAAFGTGLPRTSLNSATGPKRAALWMGPDEWTLLAPEEDLRPLQEAFSEKLSGQPHALVDISHRSEAIIVSGEKAIWLLNTGIFIDFTPGVFSVGTVTRTLFHKVPVLIWRIGEDTFVVETWGSFMDYVSGLLVEAARELEAT